jgi:hypothetical protein
LKIVRRKYRGKELNVVYDCPCDNGCSKFRYCKANGTYCSAFTQYVNFGWFDVTTVQKRMKRL